MMEHPVYAEVNDIYSVLIAAGPYHFPARGSAFRLPPQTSLKILAEFRLVFVDDLQLTFRCDCGIAQHRCWLRHVLMCPNATATTFLEY